MCYVKSCPRNARGSNEACVNTVWLLYSSDKLVGPKSKYEQASLGHSASFMETFMIKSQLWLYGRHTTSAPQSLPTCHIKIVALKQHVCLVSKAPWQLSAKTTNHSSPSYACTWASTLGAQTDQSDLSQLTPGWCTDACVGEARAASTWRRVTILLRALGPFSRSARFPLG